MRLPRLSPRSKKLVALLAAVRIVAEVLDWIVGKIGYLGVFTSPDDFRVMLERAPLWLQAAVDAVRPWLLTFGSWIRIVWDAATGEAGTLVVLAVLVLLLIVDAERLARLRRRLWFKMRHAVSDRVWISKETAMRVMADSDWGRLRLPHVTEKSDPLAGVLSSISSLYAERTIYGLSPAEKARRKHGMFLRRTLEGFAQDNPKATRTVEGRDEYEQGALLKFLGFALDDELERDFGRVPRYNVTEE